MAQRTEQQQRLRNYLFELMSTGGKFLRITMYSQADVKSGRYNNGRDNEPIKTEAIKQDDHVQLTLVEPLFGADYDQWATAMVKAEEYLGFLEQERLYNYENPSFFKALRSEYWDKKPKEM